MAILEPAPASHRTATFFPMLLFVDTGSAGRGPSGERGTTPCVAVVPNSPRDPHGILLALAAGISERPDADGAARDAIQIVSDSYYATPEAWSAANALNECFSAANAFVRTNGERNRATALSALVLRHRRWSLAHVGDTRVWRYRDQQLRQLSQDHVEPRVDRRAEVNQACGLEETLEAATSSGELATGDIYVITGNGVHEVLDSAMIMSCLVADIPASQMADCLTTRAAAAGGRRNVTACVVRVESLPRETEQDMAENLAALPVINPPQLGAILDAFHIEALLHKSRTYRLYRATDTETGGSVVIKFPNPRYARDPRFADSFLREEWIGKRVASPHLVTSLPLRSGRRTALYAVMAYHPGENVAERIKRKRGLSVKETAFLGRQLLAALIDLHRQGVVHRDVRPKNLLYDKKNRHLLLIGLGSSHIDQLGDQTGEPRAASGAMTYVAPEVLAGAHATPRSDIYAAGVTLYRMLTGRYPYGRTRSIDTIHSGNFVPPTRYRSDIPVWLEEALLRACATDPRDRFKTAEEFAAALGPSAINSPESPAGNPTSPRQATPQWEMFLIGALLLGLVVYLVLTFR